MQITDAINHIQYRIDTASNIASKDKDDKTFDDMKLAIKALNAIDKIISIHNDLHDAVTETMLIEKVIDEFNNTCIFQIGDEFESTCIFTGGIHKRKITEVTEDKIICESVYQEQDGTHNVTDSYNLYEDEAGQYIVLWAYGGTEAKLYAKNINRD